MTSISPPPLLDETLAAFLGGPVAINVASRDAALEPSVARAYGCRVSDDRRELVVFLSVQRSATVLRDLGAGAPVAVIFSLPRNHESRQLKGLNARILPLGPGDREVMRTYGAAFGAEIRALGYTGDFTGVLMAGIEDEAVGVAFAPTEIFEQTPGPNAGKRLSASS